jgi:hypothetical protein
MGLRIIDALPELEPEVTGDSSSSVPVANPTAGLTLAGTYKRQRRHEENKQSPLVVG